MLFVVTTTIVKDGEKVNLTFSEKLHLLLVKRIEFQAEICKISD